MKAAIVEKPGQLAVREVPEPKLGEYDCLCQLLFGATCTGTDQHILGGRFPFPLAYPTILGHESVGRVVQVGAKVRHFKTGDLISRVGHPGDKANGLNVNWGGFAQYGVARDHRAMKEDGRPRAEWDGYRINQVVPAGIDPRGATMIITWRETYSYLTRLGMRPGARVLVIGSGGNGLAFVSHARNLGAAAVAMVGSAARADQARAAGADHNFDYRAADLGAAIAAAYPDKFDFIIDAVGKTGMVNQVLGRLAPGGTVAVYGIDDFKTYNLNPWLAPSTLKLCNGGNYDEEEAHAPVTGWILMGRLNPEIWLDYKTIYPLAEIGRAMEAISGRQTVKALVDLQAV